jgi:glycosyltransferase involved in cell wall biosynthesis
LPLVISSHGTDIALLDKGGIIGKLSRYVYKRTAKASVVSSFLKEKLRQRVGILGEADIAVIPMPVGMENFPKAAPPQNNTPLLLSVARFTKQKHLTDIIAAADLVAEENVAFKILMVGEGQLEDELKNLVQQKGLTQNIEFLPLVAQQKLGELYRQCDAVILVSENEGFGLVLVEAGLTGRPAIASRSGGITDIVEDGVSGILVELGDVNAIARIMKKLFQDSNLRSRLGEGAYRRAMGTFATPILVNKIYELFKRVILI